MQRVFRSEMFKKDYVQLLKDPLQQLCFKFFSALENPAARKKEASSDKLWDGRMPKLIPIQNQPHHYKLDEVDKIREVQSPLKPNAGNVLADNKP